VQCYALVLRKREDAAREGQLHDTDDGCERLCALCGDIGAPSVGIRIHSCSARRCPRGYCDGCLDRRLLNPTEKHLLTSLRDWLCPPCTVSSRAGIAAYRDRVLSGRGFPGVARRRHGGNWGDAGLSDSDSELLEWPADEDGEPQLTRKRGGARGRPGRGRAAGGRFSDGGLGTPTAAKRARLDDGEVGGGGGGGGTEESVSGLVLPALLKGASARGASISPAAAKMFMEQSRAGRQRRPTMRTLDTGGVVPQPPRQREPRPGRLLADFAGMDFRPGGGARRGNHRAQVLRQQRQLAAMLGSAVMPGLMAPPVLVNGRTTAALLVAYVQFLQRRAAEVAGILAPADDGGGPLPTEDVCFHCCDGGDLVECDCNLAAADGAAGPGAVAQCAKVYHAACLPPDRRPPDGEGDGSPWLCPRHLCATGGCAHPPSAYCLLCPTSACGDHHASTFAMLFGRDGAPLATPPSGVVALLGPRITWRRWYTPDIHPGVTLGLCGACAALPRALQASPAPIPAPAVGALPGVPGPAPAAGAAAGEAAGEAHVATASLPPAAGI
jgi:hypothetical protein